MARGTGSCKTEARGKAKARPRSGGASAKSRGCSLCGYRYPKPDRFHRTDTPKGKWCDGNQILDVLPKEYVDAQRSEERERVMAGVRDLMTTEGWQHWVETRARFHNYSFTNTLLIWTQLRARAARLGEDPDHAFPTYVSSFKGWKELGRSVVKGEQGLFIYIPITTKAAETDDATEDEEQRRTRTRFIMRPAVFDVCQTDGEPLPESPYQPLSGDSHSHWLYGPDGALDGPLVQAASTLGYSLVEEEMRPSMGGYCKPEEKKVALNQANEPNQKVATAVHEIAHALGIDYEQYTREQAEVIVETAATIVCRKLGLDTTARSIPYIATWGQKGDWEAIRSFGETIDKVTEQIEASLNLDTDTLRKQRLIELQGGAIQTDQLAA